MHFFHERQLRIIGHNAHALVLKAIPTHREKDKKATCPYNNYYLSMYTLISTGASALGSVFRKTDDSESHQVVQYLIRNGINYVDVAPWYGHGKGETVLGQVGRRIQWRRQSSDWVGEPYDKGVSKRQNLSWKKLSGVRGFQKPPSIRHRNQSSDWVGVSMTRKTPHHHHHLDTSLNPEL